MLNFFPNYYIIVKQFSKMFIFCIFVGSVITIKGHDIVPIFDVPHLAKTFRNNLMNKNMTVPREAVVPSGGDKPRASDGKTPAAFATWDVVRLAYMQDAFRVTGDRKLPHLHENHVNPAIVNKLRVCHAMYILSKSLSSFIKGQTSSKIFSFSLICVNFQIHQRTLFSWNISNHQNIKNYFLLNI